MVCRYSRRLYGGIWGWLDLGKLCLSCTSLCVGLSLHCLPLFSQTPHPPWKNKWWVKSVWPRCGQRVGRLGLRFLVYLASLNAALEHGLHVMTLTLRASHRLHDWSVKRCLQHCGFRDSPSSYQERGDRFMSSASEALYWHQNWLRSMKVDIFQGVSRELHGDIFAGSKSMK